MQRRVHRHTDDGASSVEYGILIALISAAIVVSVALFGTGVGDLFTNTCEAARDDGGIAADCD